ncbi:MAG TPA: PIN domain-containing protein [Phenylobacterium sp.]|jgi:predicted nucleic acid-binding protein
MIQAVLDADVIYPLPLRDTLLSAAVEGCFRPLWSEQILDEAIRNLVADRRMTEASAARMHAALMANFEDSWVEGYEHRIAGMPNHPKDRHVAACAAEGGAGLIVTSNLKDFADLPEGVKAVSPDEFLCDLMVEHPDRMRAALVAQSARLKKEPLSVAQILGLLAPVTPGFVAVFKAVHPDLADSASDAGNG